VEAVARQLVGRDIVPDVAALCGPGQQVSDHGAELVLCPHDLLVAMQERREFGVVMPMRLMLNQR
jgi:hypothetical protein